jgi:hypothetical protein
MVSRSLPRFTNLLICRYRSSQPLLRQSTTKIVKPTDSTKERNRFLNRFDSPSFNLTLTSPHTRSFTLSLAMLNSFERIF